MRNTAPVLAVLVIAGALVAGCAGPEKKLGRGMNNTMDIVRLGEFRRSMEQGALFQNADYAYSTGMVKGLGRTFARMGLGIYEVVTFPLKNSKEGYDPICADSFPPGSVYPDSYTPTLVEESTFSTDTNLGFAGGDVMPNIPGSRFRIFDTH
jgi:putative exosortase-associated protein (TIGR04073 family)